jgi:uroporphyrinogen-III synthase
MMAAPDTRTIRDDSIGDPVSRTASPGDAAATETSWIDVCELARILPDRGVCALVGKEQVAIFRTSPDDALYAVSNFDPISSAFVISRGIVGSRGDIPKVASPIFKQTFNLETGQCFEKPEVALKTYPVRMIDGRVQVGVIRQAAPPEETKPPARSTGRPLEGLVIALPETREIERLTRLIEQKGAQAFRVPMVSMTDASDPAPIEAWLRGLIRGEIDDLILLTGEGLHRLLGFATRAGIHREVVTALGRVRTVSRGPKPARALRALGYLPSIPAEPATSEGIVESLRGKGLQGRVVGVQLYGQEPNPLLVDFLKGEGAEVRTVAPYVYVTASKDEIVADLIQKLAAGNIDVIAFTSSSQVDRLFEVAKCQELGPLLHAGLNKTSIAAVGPIVATTLRRHGCRIDVVPSRSFFLQTLVKEMIAVLPVRRP